MFTHILCYSFYKKHRLIVIIRDLEWPSVYDLDNTCAFFGNVEVIRCINRETRGYIVR